jgi:AraC family transcriptional regulator
VNAADPTIEFRGPYSLWGLAYRGGETAALSGLWDRLMNLTGRLEERSNVLIGVGRPLEGNHFEYFAGMVPIREVATAPEGLEQRNIPRAKYAVFLHQGPLSRISDTYELAYERWFPASGHEPGEYFLEIYDDRFIGPTAYNSIIEIAIPLLT